MTTEIITGKPRRPVWGTVSLCCPLAGIVFGLWALWDVSGKEAAGFVFCILVVLFSCFLGIISVAIALARAERFWPLTFMGMVLNGVPLILLLISYAR
jgi:hypothetical protein